MMRKLVIILVSSVICLLGVIPVLAQADYPYVWTSAPDSAYKGEHRWVWATPQDYEKFTGKTIEKYNEAPMLRMKVAAGELPPIEERLPEEPLIINPLEEIGEYGGIVQGTSKIWSGIMEIDVWEPLLRCNVQQDLYGARPRPNVPNVAKGWEILEDFRSMVLHLRKGLKWSDGKPFTADDIAFWYEDVLLNKELTPVIARNWIVEGEVWKFQKIDDYTIRFDFAEPNPWALYFLATWGPEEMVKYPKHYMKHFHMKYNAKAKELAEKEGVANWYELFSKQSDKFANVDLPTLSPYVLRERTTRHILFERNPYYFKVDPAGNQLPYFDGLYSTEVGDVEMYETRIVTGRVDFESNTSLASYPLYVENAERGNYRVLTSYAANYGTVATIGINQTYAEDPVLRNIFRDVRFRRALSVAIDREEINELMFFGKGVPRQETVAPISTWFLPEFAEAYVEYNPEKANALLDEMGLKWDENHRYRLRPDGKRLSAIVESFVEPWMVVRSNVAEIIVKYWKRIGIDAKVKAQSYSLYSQRRDGNQIQIAVGLGSSGSDDNFIVMPSWYVASHCSLFASLWEQWYLSDGEKGEKPPEELLRVTRLFEQLKTTTDPKDRLRLGREIMRSQTENLWTIGTLGLIPVPLIAAKNLRNIPEKGMNGVAGTWSIDFYYPEQWFFKHPLLKRQK